MIRLIEIPLVAQRAKIHSKAVNYQFLNCRQTGLIKYTNANHNYLIKATIK